MNKSRNGRRDPLPAKAGMMALVVGIAARWLTGHSFGRKRPADPARGAQQPAAAGDELAFGHSESVPPSGQQLALDKVVNYVIRYAWWFGICLHVGIGDAVCLDRAPSDLPLSPVSLWFF